MNDAQGADPLVRVVVRRLGADAQEPVVFDALLRRYASGMLELVGAGATGLPPLERDEDLLVGRPVAGDATYDQRVHVLGSGSGGAVRIAPDGERTRNQQREHVRVETMPFDVHLTLVVDDDDDESGESDQQAIAEPSTPPPSAPAAGTVRSANRRGPLMVRTSAAAPAEPDEPEDDDSIPLERTGSVRDVSAGGLRVFHDGVPYERGQQVQVEVTLPGDGGPAMPLESLAEVRWTGAAPYDRVAVGLQFVDLPRATERQLAQWVFRHQAKQVRDAKR